MIYWILLTTVENNQKEDSCLLFWNYWKGEWISSSKEKKNLSSVGMHACMHIIMNRVGVFVCCSLLRVLYINGSNIEEIKSLKPKEPSTTINASLVFISLVYLLLLLPRGTTVPVLFDRWKPRRQCGKQPCRSIHFDLIRAMSIRLLSYQARCCRCCAAAEAS